MDSEDHGTIYIGCAGGKNTELLMDLETKTGPSDLRTVRFKVGGLKGGHSGLNIHEGRGNAIKLLTRLLWNMEKDHHIRLCSIDGGNKVNAIPRECEAIVYLRPERLDASRRYAETYDRIYREEYDSRDPRVFVPVDEEGYQNPHEVLRPDSQNRLLNLLDSLSHGVVSMSNQIPGLVETSTNLAAVRSEGGHVAICSSQRSSMEKALREICDTVAAAGRLAGAKVRQNGSYPGWKPNPDSPTLQLAKKVFSDLFEEEPKATAIHAGLECGIIGHKYPSMDMISFEPTILGAHSPDERVLIPTVRKFWDFLLAMLENLSSQHD